MLSFESCSFFLFRLKNLLQYFLPANYLFLNSSFALLNTCFPHAFYYFIQFSRFNLKSSFSFVRSLTGFFLRLLCLTLVGTSGLEPPTSRLSGVRSNHLSYAPFRMLDTEVCFSEFPSSLGGDKENRTLDPLLAKQVLSQLSYTPLEVRNQSRDV